jgi:enolase-phosphatase E1
MTVRVRTPAIVTDIEGTTGSIAFVRDVLFPYAQAHLTDFVARRGADPDVRAALRDAARDAGEPAAGDARIIEILRAWMDEDRKATPLKTLQGLIWAEGYGTGRLRGHVYPDAALALRAWHAAGIALYVYSSGSIAAQKLLFGSSTEGDLLPLFSGFFDTTIGMKTDPASYAAIASAIGREAATLTFLSDREAELDAAHRAGWPVVALLRPADTPAGAVSAYPAVASFAQLATGDP